MYSYLDDANQARLDLGFNEWKLRKNKKKFFCDRQGCGSKENLIPCLYCVNSFYCSVKCREMDARNHATICNITNTKEMMIVNTYLGYKLGPILTLIAKAKFEQFGNGVINVRSYTPNTNFELVPSCEEMEMQMANDADVDEAHLFITYVPLEEWCTQMKDKGFVPPQLLFQTDYSERMIVNFHLEEMNKQQLHRLPLMQIDSREFVDSEYSKLSRFQISVPIIY